MRLMVVLGCSITVEPRTVYIERWNPDVFETVEIGLESNRFECLNDMNTKAMRPTSIPLNRFLPFRVDSGDELSFKEFSKCFESIRGDSRIDSDLDRDEMDLKRLQ
ncbi:hypothetical protein PIB30_033259 [Stylosanthes scabra]|uniref:Uncharacterized protein n=1 Tax=Stylosanthes scabra TaxID=79078 RepID=A0ABU6YB18_9FABA|nr:hypothetical protein [Stylosanthes scabra]